MKRRYIKWTVIGLALTIVASIGLIRNIGGGTEEDGRDEGQRVRPVQTNPTVPAPGGGEPAPTSETDNQRPGGGTP